MNKDQLLGELGGLARQEREAEKARLDERWDRLAAGTLTPEEDAELKALAASSPEAREAYEAFRPLGADFQARMVGAINAERTGDAPQAEPQESRSRVLPFRRAVRRIEVWLGAAAAVAAAAGLFFLVRGPALPPLPAYSVDPLIGNQTVRGGVPGTANGTPLFDPASELKVVVRPLHSITTPFEAKAFLTQNGELLPWERGESDVSGTFLFRGGLSRFRPGEWKVWIIVGRPGRIPSASTLQAELRAGRTRTADWQAISKDLRIGARASP